MSRRSGTMHVLTLPLPERENGQSFRNAEQPVLPAANTFLRSFRYVPVRSQEPAEGVLGEQEPLLPAVQPWLHPKEKHDATPAPRVRHGAQVPVPLLRQAIQVHPEHIRPHQEVPPRPAAVLQTALLNPAGFSPGSPFIDAPCPRLGVAPPRSMCERKLIKSFEPQSSKSLHFRASGRAGRSVQGKQGVDPGRWIPLYRVKSWSHCSGLTNHVGRLDFRY